jgi:signal transduction histidine kinase
LSTTLRVLHVEDSANDSELLQIQLRRAGFEVTSQRVETEEAFVAALETHQWDVILADHALPGFGAPRALELLKERALDVPFVVISGTIGMAVAVELMKAGAHDFVSKDEPARLEPILRRELREAANREARRRADADRERLVAQLETANRAKDEFLALLGHELRNPLAPMVTALQVMSLRDPEPNREREILERQVHHMVRLVDDLLDVARVARGKLELKKRNVELAVVVAKGIEIASSMMEQRRHVLTIDLPGRGLPLDADEGRLAQVVANLLTNAARYTLPGGAVSIAGRLENGEVVLRVKDNGIGIEAAMLPKIFDAFVQGSREIDRSVGGLGIGLSLVRNLVKLHGGTVSAHSEGPDQGSEFIVRLPAAPAAVTEPRPPAPLSRRTPRGSGQVLIVDDNEDAAEVLAEAMRMEGYKVEIAHDGPRALAALDYVIPRIIILDIGLPAMDGYEVARRIRVRAEHKTTRLLAVTGYGQPADRDRALGAGFDQHFAKPVDLDELLAAMEGNVVRS